MSAVAKPARRERRVALPGVELYLLEAGEGPPLVLLHGWPQHGGMWEPMIDELAADYRVLVPDLRGFRHSEAPPGDYSKHSLTADILALLDSEAIEQATIVGHDWGGWIAWLLALEHPKRVERFASLDVPPPRGIGASPARIPRRLLYGSYQLAVALPFLGERLVGSERAMRAILQGGTGRRTRLNEELLDDYARATAAPDTARASVALYRTFLTRELPAIARGTYTVRELNVPGLVIMGGESPITKMTGVPAEGPELEVAVIDDAGHFIVDEAPDQVLALLRPFLAAGRTPRRDRRR